MTTSIVSQRYSSTGSIGLQLISITFQVHSADHFASIQVHSANHLDPLHVFPADHKAIFCEISANHVIFSFTHSAIPTVPFQIRCGKYTILFQIDSANQKLPLYIPLANRVIQVTIQSTKPVSPLQISQTWSTNPKSPFQILPTKPNNPFSPLHIKPAIVPIPSELFSHARASFVTVKLHVFFIIIIACVISPGALRL